MRYVISSLLVLCCDSEALLRSPWALPKRRADRMGASDLGTDKVNLQTEVAALRILSHMNWQNSYSAGYFKITESLHIQWHEHLDHLKTSGYGSHQGEY